MDAERGQRRWTVAVATVVTQVCLGAVYGWSVFVNPIVQREGWPLSQVSLVFTLALAFLGLGTIVGGLWQDRVGPRPVITAAGLLYGAGYVIAGVATARHSLVGLYVGYGVIAGIAMGMGYICPIAVLSKWFPDKRGLMTGIAVCGYGAGALVMSPVAAYGIQIAGLPATFVTLGTIYLVIITVAARFYVNPSSSGALEHTPDSENRPSPMAATARIERAHEYGVAEAVMTPRFWLLWTLLFMNVSAGIMVLSQVSPMAQEIAGLSPLAATAMVGLISLANAAGRVFWAWVSDAIGRASVFVLLYAIQAATLFMLPGLHDPTLFGAALVLVGLCYGGGFGTMPSFTADAFGAKNMGGIYGWMLLAWSVAAIPSPLLIAYVRQTTGHHDPALYTLAAVMLVATLVPLAVRHPAPGRGAVLRPTNVVATGSSRP